MAETRLLHHTLIGRRVEWRGDLWTVTGARREDGSSDVAFRLLPLNADMPREEVWTEPRPTFGERSRFDAEAHVETLPARAACYVRREMAKTRRP